MSIFFIEDKNGDYFSADEKRRFIMRYLPLKSVISEKRNGAHSMSLIARRKAADMKYHCMLSKRMITVKDVRARN